MKYNKIVRCRICGNENLVDVLDIGFQALTGVFPKGDQSHITKGPVVLTKCEGKDSCGLVQMRFSYDLTEMYGLNYGYRSGLNSSMVKHLHGIVADAKKRVDLKDGDVILDIGSNDSTLLQGYGTDKKLDFIGCDPTGIKFKSYYPSHIKLVEDFFPSENLDKVLKGRKPKVITSIAMVYDLEDPQSFFNQIAKTLDKGGIWIFEQSYLPMMLKTNSFDTACHEHVEYYSLRPIQWMLDKAGLKILDISVNSANGGSSRIIATHKDSPLPELTSEIQKFFKQEEDEKVNDLATWKKFQDDIVHVKNDLLNFLKDVKAKKEKLVGVGASTKGNVLLQYCGIDSELLPCIAEVNQDKFGAFTPETKIPIISEKDAFTPDLKYKLILPWHFKDFFVVKEKEFIEKGGVLVFPLPRLEFVRK